MQKIPVPKESRRKRWHSGAPLDAGHQFLTAHGAALKGLRPITPRQYVQRGLDLANWDGEDLEEFQQLAERLLVGGEWEPGTRVLDQPPVSEGDRYSGQFYRDILISELAPLLKERPRVRPREIKPGVKTPLDVPPFLTADLTTDASARRKVADRLTTRRHGHVAAIGVAWQDGDRTAFGWVMRPDNLHSAIHTVLWLLTAEDQPFADELRQCKWNDCFNFFLAEKTKAGPRLSYCPFGNCMEAAHLQNTPERKAARKAGMTVKAYRERQAKNQNRRK